MIGKMHLLKLAAAGVLLAALAIGGIGLSPVHTAVAQEGGTPPTDGILITIIGTVEVLEPDLIVVSGVTVAPAGAFQPADLTLGDQVIITGYLLPDDTLWAVSLEIVPEDEIGEPEPPTEEPDPGDVEPPTEEPDPGDVEPPTEEPDPGDIEPTCADWRNDQPVAESLALEFEVDYTLIMDWHCSGYGFGEIARALLIARSEQGDEEEGDPEAEPALSLVDFAQELLDRRAAGEGWGDIKKDYDVSPSALAPGQAIAADKIKQVPPGQAKKDQDQEQEQEQEQVQSSANPSQSNPGHGGTPPGQDKDKDKSKGKK